MTYIRPRWTCKVNVKNSQCRILNILLGVSSKFICFIYRGSHSVYIIFKVYILVMSGIHRVWLDQGFQWSIGEEERNQLKELKLATNFINLFLKVKQSINE